jgi:hypothetical protein
LKTQRILEPVQTEQGELEAARRQPGRVLANSGFSRNDRLSRFLRFVVERHLEGKHSDIKESLLRPGVEAGPPR